jgi:hypothetical protein
MYTLTLRMSITAKTVPCTGYVHFSSVVAAEAEEMGAAVQIGNVVCEAASAAAHISASG